MSRPAALTTGLWLTVCSVILAQNAPTGKSASITPVMSILDRFTSPDVPALGLAETEVPPRTWNQPIPSGLPGNGIAQHPMLYIGEGYNKIFLNGNTLITDEKNKLTFEVNPKGERVWELKPEDLPPPFRFIDTQSCTRLANGNTIICSRGDGGKGPQLVEVTQDKKVVWVLHDWANLGPATAVQILDDPGIPENPGESEH
jgi:hypothetical protein